MRAYEWAKNGDHDGSGGQSANDDGLLQAVEGLNICAFAALLFSRAEALECSFATFFLLREGGSAHSLHLFGFKCFESFV